MAPGIILSLEVLAHARATFQLLTTASLISIFHPSLSFVLNFDMKPSQNLLGALTGPNMG